MSEIPVLDPLGDFLADKAKGRDRQSGSYRRNIKRDVQSFVDWYEHDNGDPPTFADLSDLHFRQYARALVVHRDGPDADPTERKDLSDGTARTYYANLSAYIGWCVDEEYLDEHLAQTDRATDPLPEDDGRRSGDQQAWTQQHREQLLQHLREQKHAVYDDSELGDGVDEWEAVKASRNLALAEVMVYSGIRGGELLAHPEDDRREGVRWRDVDFEDSHIVVLAKRQTSTWDERPLPENAHGALRTLHKTLDPASEDWPVFPSLHRPTLYDQLRDAMTDGGVPADEADDRVRAEPTFALCREYDVAPAPLQTHGARSMLRQACDTAGIDLDDDHGYLTPHGARRAVGEILVRTKGFAAAARQLDDTERMVRERYSHIEAADQAEVTSQAFEEYDSEPLSDGD